MKAAPLRRACKRAPVAVGLRLQHSCRASSGRSRRIILAVWTPIKGIAILWRCSPLVFPEKVAGNFGVQFSCKCKKLDGTVVHGTHQLKALSAEEEANGIVLACRVKPLSDIRLRVLGKMKKKVCA